MNDPKKIYRKGNDTVRKVGRELDGHDVGDDVGNLGDTVRSDIGNAGDDIRGGAKHVEGHVDRPAPR
jgi:hypothetical protein